MRIDVYTWQDAYIATIGPDDLLAFTHTDELNGEDSVDVTTTFPLKQGYRLVWADRLGKLHEHVCQDPKGLHANGETLYTDTALNSVCELYGDYIEDKRPYAYSFANALQVALETTRWAMGFVDQPGTVSRGLTFYHTSAREALQSILECGGELETEIAVSGGCVSSRKIGIRAHRGAKAGHRRFTYTKDIKEIARTEHYGAITACYGYGKGVETDSGGYGRKLTFGEINAGVNYVEDLEALKKHGRPDGKGGFSHVFGQFEDSDCEDAATLLSETREYLDSHSDPGVTYEADVLDLVQFGSSWEGVAVGDDVQIVDTEFSPELRCEGRVTRLVTDMLGGAQTVTLGNVTDTMADLLSQQQKTVDGLSKRSSNWDVAASTPAAYLQQVINGLNERFNVSGMSYLHMSFEHGIITASVPLDENGNPTKTPATAMQMCSQGFRIASKTKADGTFDWQTFGTGEGFYATMMVAGILNANLIKAGILQDAAGKNYINMETGDCRLAATATAGGKPIATQDAVIKSVDVEYAQGASLTQAPTSGWQTDAPSWEAGKYIWQRTKTVAQSGAASYSKPTCISGRDGVDGEKGDQGEQGIGIESIAEQYYLSTSSTTQTGGYWSTSQPTWVSGRHYWTRSRITWGDGAVSYTTPVLARAVTSSNQKVDDLDDALNQQEIFNRLTNNGATQGIFMQNGKLYLNATYMTSGYISNSKNTTNFWNLETGYFKAGNITATGSFLGGSKSTGYGMELTTGAKLTGYYNGSQYGYVDCTGSAYDVSNPSTIYHGLQLQGNGIIRVSTPRFSISGSSDTSVTTTAGFTGYVGAAFHPLYYDSGEGKDVFNQNSQYSCRLRFVNGLLVSKEKLPTNWTG